MERIDLIQGTMAGACECVNELSGCTKCGKFLDQLLKKLRGYLWYLIAESSLCGIYDGPSSSGSGSSTCIPDHSSKLSFHHRHLPCWRWTSGLAKAADSVMQEPHAAFDNVKDTTYVPCSFNGTFNRLHLN